LNKGQFDCPKFEETAIVGTMTEEVMTSETSSENRIKPNFQHLRQLHSLELGKPVKYAYRLTDKCLNPAPIERTNVMLANSVFHESTINALWHYSESNPEFADTATFLRIIRTWWDIVNVKTPTVGKHKRDVNKEPFTLENEHAQHFFRSFSTWLKEWKNSAPRDRALSAETFTTAIQTTDVLPQLAADLIQTHGLDYVLLGKIQSDPLEKRFGWYRKLAGSNYFCSVRQMLDGEKSIRLKSLVKFSDFELSEIRDVFQTANAEREQAVTDSVSLLSERLEIVLSSCDLDEEACAITLK